MDATPAPEAATGAAADTLASGVASLTLEERFAILRGIGEECIQEDELVRLLQNKPVPICYDGFEPSGRMHIAQVRTFPHCISYLRPELPEAACMINCIDVGGLFMRGTGMGLVLLPEVAKTNDNWLGSFYLIQ
jgi:hypothetical protein